MYKQLIWVIRDILYIKQELYRKKRRCNNFSKVKYKDLFIKRLITIKNIISFSHLFIF